MSVVARGNMSFSALGDLARERYKERRLRDSGFGEDLFGEAAWDILLDLFASETEGKIIWISSACIGACVPATTAIRHIRELERRGLVVRSEDNGDRRAQQVRLTDQARSEMAALLGRFHLARLSRLSADPSKS